MADLAVYLEVGSKRVFAAALDWPGWARSGRTEEAALETLAEYADRYAPIAAAAGLILPAVEALDVQERVPGSAATDFGALGAVPELDHRPLTAAAAGRLTDLVEAAWACLADVAASSPAELRKGPRGGGRDRDKMLAHVVEAEASYARKIDVRHRPPAFDDSEAVAAMRADIAAALRSARGANPDRPKDWPARYAARRIAWHVLDHAWEMQDKSVPA